MEISRDNRRVNGVGWCIGVIFGRLGVRVGDEWRQSRGSMG